MADPNANLLQETPAESGTESGPATRTATATTTVRRTKNDLINDLEERDKQIAMLHQMIADLQNEVAQSTVEEEEEEGLAPRRPRETTADTQMTGGNAHSSQRSEKVPDPPIFRNDDDDEEDFEQWFRDMENKLEVNADRYQNDKARQTYIESRLGGKAKRDLAPYLRSGHPDPINTSARLLTHLWEQYYDPDKEQKALDDWDKLKQETSKDFLAFKNDFVRLAGECQKPRSSWKKEFNRKLTASYQRQLGVSYLDPTVTFEQLARLAQQLAQINKRASQEQAARRQINPKPVSRAEQKRAATPSAVGNTRSKPTTLAKRLTPDEVRTLIQEGRCFNCRERGHRAPECPNKKPARETDPEREARVKAIVARYAEKEGASASDGTAGPSATPTSTQDHFEGSDSSESGN